MEKYYYTKLVKSNEVLAFQEIVKLSVSLTLAEKIGFNIKPCKSEMDLQDDNILITTPQVLTSDELDEIAAAINSFNSNHPLVIRNDIRINHVDPNITWGLNMIATFGANNLYLDKSLPDLQLLINDFSGITTKLLIGAVEMAYIDILQLPVTSYFSQEEKDEFIKRFELYLGKALTDAIKAQLGGA